MGYKETYQFWLEDDYFDAKTKEELKAIAGDEKEIEDRFYRELEFGTGGLSGPPGAITWASTGNHVGPQGKSRGPPGAITSARGWVSRASATSDSSWLKRHRLSEWRL